MSLEWPNEKTLYLIELYRMQELLWNTKHTNHYNKSARFNAWKEIASDMAITVDECQKKMNSVLSSLRRERAKIRKGRGNGKGQAYQSSWFAFKNLHFLLTKEGRHGNTRTPDNAQEKYVNQLMQETDASPSTHHTTANNVPQDYPFSPPYAASPQKKQKFCKEKRNESDIITQATMNECQFFGNFVATKLFKYTPHTRSAVQHEISNIIFSADHGYFEPGTSKSSHFQSTATAPSYLPELEINNHSNELSPISSPGSSEDLETENLI